MSRRHDSHHSYRQGKTFSLPLCVRIAFREFDLMILVVNTMVLVAIRIGFLCLPLSFHLLPLSLFEQDLASARCVTAAIERASL